MEETTSGAPGAGGAGTGDDAGTRFGKAKDFVNEKYSAASDFTRSQYNRAKEKIEDVDFGAITDQVRSYVRDAAGTPSAAEEISKLASLRDQGVLTDDEFQAQKTKLLTA